MMGAGVLAKVDRSRWIGIAVVAGLWAFSVAAKLPVLGAPAYWDEGLHYWTAKHLGQGFDRMTDLWGNPVGTPEYLVFQRPLFYVLFWLPAQGGFSSFRVAHALAASVLAPLAYAVLRAHGARRPAAVLAGVAVALVPSLAMWGNLGLMDSLMTAWLALLLWARATGRDGLMFVAAVAAVWTKETAFAAVLGLLAFEAARAWMDGRAAFAPLRLDGRVTALAWAAAVAPWPLVWAVMHDLALPGAVNHGSVQPVLDRMFGSLWLVPVLVVGLASRRSRFLCAFALAAGAFLVGLQLAARDVPQWYEVPTTFFALVACAAAGDALWRARPRRGLAWGRAVPAGVALLVTYLLVALPNGDARDALRPLSGDGGNSLAGSWAFETGIRDAELHAAFAAVPLEMRPDVYDIDIAAPAMYVPFADEAGHIYWDSSWIRTLIEIDTAPAAHRIEANGTWTVVDRSDLPFAAAVLDVYADCIRYENPGFVAIEGSACAGRADRLEAAWRERDPRF